MDVAKDASSGAGDRVPPAHAAEQDREERLARLLRAWWHEERPPWTEPSWWEATLREDVRRLLWLKPGPDLVAGLAELPVDASCVLAHDQDRALPDWPTPGHAPGWPCACQVVVAAAWDACASWLAIRSAGALVAAAGPRPVRFDVAEGRQRIEDPAREELAHALRSSIPSMGNRIGVARALTAQPGLVELVESGAVSSWAARLVLDHLTDLDDHQAGAVVAEVAARVRQRLTSARRPYHSADVNRLARAARLRVCPETEAQVRRRSVATRRVTVHPTGQGMATLVAELPDTDAHRIHRRLTAIAAGLAADARDVGAVEPRTRDQLRADVLVDLVLGREPGAVPEHPRAAEPPPHPAPAHLRAADQHPRADIQVLISLATLLGENDDPAELAGLGPIPAEIARDLAADGAWRAWIVDAAGAIVATGSRGYVPTAAVARLVRAREPHCRFPGCRQPATRCDLDHAIPWPRGATTAGNLGPLCRRHHNLKTHAPWTLIPNPVDPPGRWVDPPDHPADAGWRWRTPAGLTVRDAPEPHLRS